ncbi:MAG: hypothetical protein IPG45_06020 [Deltaproteobacteria bacterium]|nr:hypothetical protein [Deltaproteobacteria bacterium]
MKLLNAPGLHITNAEPVGEILDTGISWTIARPVDGAHGVVLYAHAPLTRAALLAAAQLMLELESAHLSGVRADVRRGRYVVRDFEPDAE